MSRPLKPSKSRPRWIIGILVTVIAFALLVVSTLLLPPSPETLPDSITNSRAAGTKAMAQVLRANGVTVTQVTELDAALSAAQAGTTLAIVTSADLSSTALDRLNAAPADLVVIATGLSFNSFYSTVEGLTDDAVTLSSSTGSKGHVAATCGEPDALAAVSITVGAMALYPLSDEWPADVAACFPISGSANIDVLYAGLQVRSHRVTVLAGDQTVRNDTIASEGNAALALRTLGRHQTLTWYLPGADAQDDQAPTLDPTGNVWGLLPPWSQPVLGLGLVAAAAAAWWRGRRFGKLVPEKLPVHVPASEAAAGLGRLYRQAHACGHAGAALRAATISRLATRLGLPPGTEPNVVVRRIAEATDTRAEALSALLYGAPPATDPELLDLATRLQHLESERP